MTMMPFPDGSNPDLGIPPLPDNMMGGIDEALKRNAALGQQRQGGGLFGGGFKVGSPLRDFLGRLGDALLMANGHQPIYQQRLQEKRRNSALQTFLGDLDPELAAALGGGLDAETAIGIYKLKHQQPDLPGIAREAQYYERATPEQRASIDRYMKLRFPGMMAPITLGPDDTIEMPGEGGGSPAGGGAGGVPTVSSAAEAIGKYPPGTIVQSPDGRRFKVPGGAPGQSPAPTFP